MDSFLTKVAESPTYGLILPNKAMLMCIAVNVNNRSGQQPKTYLAECGNTKDQGRRDKQGSAIEHHGALSKGNSTFFTISSTPFTTSPSCGHSLR